MGKSVNSVKHHKCQLRLTPARPVLNEIGIDRVRASLLNEVGNSRMQSLVVLVVFTDFSVVAIGRYARHIYVGQPKQYPDIPLPFSRSGPSCSKLRMSLVSVSLKFPTLISQIRQYFC